MLKIKDSVDLKELEKFGFVLDGNTYKYFIKRNLCVYVCIYDRKLVKPELPIITSRMKELFTSKKPYKKLSGIMYELEKADLLEKASD